MHRIYTKNFWYIFLKRKKLSHAKSNNHDKMCYMISMLLCYIFSQVALCTTAKVIMIKLIMRKRYTTSLFHSLQCNLSTFFRFTQREIVARRLQHFSQRPPLACRPSIIKCARNRRLLTPWPTIVEDVAIRATLRPVALEIKSDCVANSEETVPFVDVVLWVLRNSRNAWLWKNSDCPLFGPTCSRRAHTHVTHAVQLCDPSKLHALAIGKILLLQPKG